MWSKDKLKIQVEYMEKQNILFSHTSYNIVNANNKIVSSRSAKKKIIFQDLITSCDIGLSTVILKSSLLNKNKFLFPRIKTKEDYVLWLKIIKKIEAIRGLDVKLTYYRKTKGSLSSNKLLSLINGYKVFKISALKNINLIEKSFAFEPEVTIKLAKKKYKFYEVPISYNGRSYEEGKKIGLKDAFIALKTIILYSLRN